MLFSPGSLANGVLYGTGYQIASLDPSLLAMNVLTGATLWNIPLSEYPYILLVSGSDIYLGLGNGNIAAFSTATGSALWQVQTTSTPIRLVTLP